MILSLQWIASLSLGFSVGALEFLLTNKGAKQKRWNLWHWSVSHSQTNERVTMFSLAAFVCCVLAFFTEPAILTLPNSCSKVDVPFCKNVLRTDETYKTPYTKEQQKKMNLEDYIPLVNIQCSPLSRLFICTSHLPFCTSHLELQPILPCRSVCLDVFVRCFRYFNLTQLPWPKHLNCSFFPRPPAICIKPSTASLFTTSQPATSSSTKSPSGKSPSTTTPTLSARSLPATQTTPQASTFYFTFTQATDTDFPSFILFIGDFVPKLIYYLTVAFVLISFVVLLCYFMFVSYFCFSFYFWWLRIRGQPNH